LGFNLISVVQGATFKDIEHFPHISSADLNDCINCLLRDGDLLLLHNLVKLDLDGRLSQRTEPEFGGS
jgi:hypothetical protein